MNQPGEATASSVVILCGAVCFMPGLGTSGATGGGKPVDAVTCRQDRSREAEPIGGLLGLLRCAAHVLAALTFRDAAHRP